MKALFIGRFQPFHKGHLQIVKDTSDNYSEVIIGIGSSQYGNNSDNPFTAEERKKMISKSLEEIKITNFKIVLIPDIHDPPKWVDHVLTIIPDFDVVFSNNALTQRLFSEKGYEVIKTPLYKKEEYSGDVIRKRIKDGKQWDDLVPPEVHDIIKNIKGEKRLKEL